MAYSFWETNTLKESYQLHSATPCLLRIGVGTDSSSWSKQAHSSIYIGAQSLSHNGAIGTLPAAVLRSATTILHRQLCCGRKLRDQCLQAAAVNTDAAIVVVLIHGGPLDVSWLEQSDRVDAILSAWHPGQVSNSPASPAIKLCPGPCPESPAACLQLPWPDAYA